MFPTIVESDRSAEHELVPIAFSRGDHRRSRDGDVVEGRPCLTKICASEYRPSSDPSLRLMTMSTWAKPTAWLDGSSILLIRSQQWVNRRGFAHRRGTSPRRVFGARRSEDVGERCVEQAEVGDCTDDDPPSRAARRREFTEEQGERPMRRNGLRRDESPTSHGRPATWQRRSRTTGRHRCTGCRCCPPPARRDRAGCGTGTETVGPPGRPRPGSRRLARTRTRVASRP